MTVLSNPFWDALQTEHAHLALGNGAARRYPADILPLGGVADPSTQTLTQFRDLLTPGESIYLTGDRPVAIQGLDYISELPVWQMHFPPKTVPAISSESIPIRTLDRSDAPAMVELTDIAFPGFFRPRSYLLGSYYGIEIDGQLIAMAGERAVLPGFREISAVCTHPAHTGQGYAALLIGHLLRAHAATGWRSFLHVGAANHRALKLYEHLGFVKTASIPFNQLRRL